MEIESSDGSDLGNIFFKFVCYIIAYKILFYAGMRMIFYFVAWSFGMFVHMFWLLNHT